MAQQRPALDCSAVAAPRPAYAGGIAEPLPDILLTCEPDAPAAGLSPGELRLSVSVSLNTSVTNALDPDSDVTDAVLEVLPGDCDSLEPAGEASGSCASSSRSVESPQAGRLTSVRRIEWPDVRVPGPGAAVPAASRETVARLRIRGIRANAAQLRLAGGSVQTSLPVIATVAVRTDSAVTVRNGTLPIAYPKPALGLSVVGEESSSACSGEGRGLASIHLREGFASAFRAGFGGESESPATRVMLEFEGVPEGTAVSLPAAAACHQPAFDGSNPQSADALVLGLVSGHDAMGRGGSASLGPLSSAPSVPLDLDAGRGRAVYEVQSEDASRLEDCHLPVMLDAGPESAAQARATVSASLAPRSDVFVASSDLAGSRFAGPSRNARTVIDLAPCGTTLLFPFVTNQAGFTTGMVITHGSRQALAGSIDGQAGSCDLHYYGADSGGSGILLVQHSTVIEPGEQLTFTLSEGDPVRNILGVEQFQGYVMATCGYPNARGYAFIADGFGGLADLAMGYLAPEVQLGSDGKRKVPAGNGP